MTCDDNLASGRPFARPASGKGARRVRQSRSDTLDHILDCLPCRAIIVDARRRATSVNRLGAAILGERGGLAL